MKVVSFSLEQNNQYYGKIDGKKFFIGSRVYYQGGKGLANSKGISSQKYNRDLFRGEHGFWADFIHPTAVAEGGFFHTLNTYDSAHFTFSFLQFAAHVPNGDFVLYLRKILTLPLASEYFPDLIIFNGRICKITESGHRELENDSSTIGLIDYFNPSINEVEDTEIIQSAKMIHWVQNDLLHQKMQVTVGIENFKEKMKKYANAYKLDGVVDVVCLIVADIRHQGRASSSSIIYALNSNNPMDSLLKLGENRYAVRIHNLRKEIEKLKDEGVLGLRKYDSRRAEFL